MPKFKDLKTGQVFKSPTADGEGVIVAVKTKDGQPFTIAFIFDDVFVPSASDYDYFWEKEYEVIGEKDVTHYQKIHRVKDVDITPTPPPASQKPHTYTSPPGA